MNELNEIDLEEIARLITEGFTSGLLNNGEGKNISWELKCEIWGEHEESIKDQEVE